MSTDVDTYKTAWHAICGVLNDVAPGWMGQSGMSRQEQALQAIRKLAQSHAEILDADGLPVEFAEFVQGNWHHPDGDRICGWRMPLTESADCMSLPREWMAVCAKKATAAR